MRTRLPPPRFVLVLGLAAIACSKQDDGDALRDPMASSPSAESTAREATGRPTGGLEPDSVPPSRATPSVDAALPEDASTDAAAHDPRDAGVKRSDASKGSSPPPRAAIPPSDSCGRRPLPECPLQAWMKRNTSAAVTTRDYEALEEAFHAMERFAPSADPLVVAAALSAGYPNWASIARDGAQAARIRDLDAVKAACRGCHEQYKAKYKAELRARTLP